jgi:type I restriction enzyme M protein
MSTFSHYFDVFGPPRPLAAIDTELKQVTGRILTLIQSLSA